MNIFRSSDVEFRVYKDEFVLKSAKKEKESKMILCNG
jgi:hypothetical protein